MNAKKRILFVDDDVHILHGLQRGLHSMKDEWDMEFVSSGREAIDAMEALPIDALITDMRMPEIDGLQVLDDAMTNHPQAVRVVLSGQAATETIVQAAASTHLIFIKPCDIELIKERVQRLLRRNDRLQDESLRNLVAQVAVVPSLPILYLEVVTELESREPSLEKIAQLVSMDMGMSATVLHFINSGYFGSGSPVSGPDRAVRMLGLEVVRDLIVSNRVCSPIVRAGDSSRFDSTLAWCEASGASVAARAIARAHSNDPVLAEDAFAAGLFHDIGQVVLSRALGSFYDSVIDRSLSSGIPLWVAERDMIGSTHAQVGAHLLGLWGMPDAVVDAVAWHHSPSGGSSEGFSALTAVHLADTMEHQRFQNIFAVTQTADRDYLRRLGLNERWEHWLAALSGADSAVPTT